MGCASSKRIEASVSADVYRPTVFDISSIQEPWLTADDLEDDAQEEQGQKQRPMVPSPIALEKLSNSLEAEEEAPPRPWDEVRKDLEVIKPTLLVLPTPVPTTITAAPPPPNASSSSLAPLKQSSKKVKRKSFSFHTLEELDTKVVDSINNAKPPKPLKTSESREIEYSIDDQKLNKLDSSDVKPSGGLKKKINYSSSANSRSSSATEVVVSEGYKPVRENIFLLKDRMEREKELGKKGPGFTPLSEYTELCPPGGADSVVLYTTSLGGVRRTYEDCYKVRSILELHRVVYDERDVSLHGEFLRELKELLGEGQGEGGGGGGGVPLPPRLFVKGRYIGGVEEVVNLNEAGRLRRIWNWVGAERGSGRQGCEGCGGARFVPCLDCGGSRKLVVLLDGKSTTQRDKCPECNENGLVHCPACL